MSEFAEGGYVEGPRGEPITSKGCEYAIPKEFARVWAESMLKKINEALDKNEEDGVE